MWMLGLITSDAMVVAVVVGIPAAVAALTVIWARPRSQPAIWGALSLAIVFVSAAGLTAALRGGPVATQTTGPPVTSTGVPTPAPATCVPKDAALHLVAKNTSFDVRCLAAPAHSVLSISFDNRDVGITHSFHILAVSPTADPNARTLFLGKIVTGPATVTYHVGRLRPGTYYFQCDVHPALMNGAFIVR
jgi:hypothetical protein